MRAPLVLLLVTLLAGVLRQSDVERGRADGRERVISAAPGVEHPSLDAGTERANGIGQRTKRPGGAPVHGGGAELAAPGHAMRALAVIGGEAAPVRYDAGRRPRGSVLTYEATPPPA